VDFPASTDADVGVIRTEATGAFMTVAVTVVVNTPLVALIVTEPVVIPWRTPLAEIVAIAGFEVVQATAWPSITLPVWSSTCATSCDCWPMLTLGALGDTVSEVAFAPFTAILELATTPSTMALSFTVPSAIPFTTPVLVTVAIEGFARSDQGAAKAVEPPAPAAKPAAKGPTKAQRERIVAGSVALYEVDVQAPAKTAADQMIVNHDLVQRQAGGLRRRGLGSRDGL